MNRSRIAILIGKNRANRGNRVLSMAIDFCGRIGCQWVRGIAGELLFGMCWDRLEVFFCGGLFQNATVFGGDRGESVAMKRIAGVVLRYTTCVAYCNIYVA